MKKGNSIINNSLLKNGNSNFILEILEYCEPENAISREQHFLDLLKPKYNILPTAGSLLGSKHSEETKVKMKGQNNPMFGKTGKDHPMFGKTYSHSEEAKAKISAFQASHTQKKSVKIQVTDLETNVTSSYTSIRKAAEVLGISHSGLSKRLKKTNSFIFKARYRIEKRNI